MNDTQKNAPPPTPIRPQTPVFVAFRRACERGVLDGFYIPTEFLWLNPGCPTGFCEYRVSRGVLIFRKAGWKKYGFESEGDFLDMATRRRVGAETAVGIVSLGDAREKSFRKTGRNVVVFRDANVFFSFFCDAVGSADDVRILLEKIGREGCDVKVCENRWLSLFLECHPLKGLKPLVAIFSVFRDKRHFWDACFLALFAGVALFALILATIYPSLLATTLSLTSQGLFFLAIVPRFLTKSSG